MSVTTSLGAAPAALLPAKSGKTKVLLVAAVFVLLAAGGGGAWYAGWLAMVPGMKHAPVTALPAPEVAAPSFVQLPEIVANLNAGARRSAFVKLQARLELSKPEDVAILTAAQPRIIDLFQTYLREMRPEELRGSMGTYRLREQLIARGNLAAAPAKIVDVLFTELLVQ